MAISSALREPATTARREAVGEQIGPRALAQQIDDGLRGGDEAAHGAAQRLAEGAGDDVGAIPAPSAPACPLPCGAEMAGGVAIVDHHQRVVSVRQSADLL